MRVGVGDVGAGVGGVIDCAGVGVVVGVGVRRRFVVGVV